MPAEDELTVIRTVLDLQLYDHEGNAAVFRQRVTPGYEGPFHSFAMAFSDWDALGRPVTVAMVLSPAEQ